MQIQISWLLQKPTDLDLHCLLRHGMSCSAREELIYLTPLDESQKVVALDLDLHCLLRHGMSCSAREELIYLTPLDESQKVVA